MSAAAVGPAGVELARVSGREGVAGPLQESIELVVYPEALVLRRGRILQAIRGGRSEKVIPLAAIERVVARANGVELVLVDGTDVGPARSLHGKAATTVLAVWWAMNGRADTRLVGAPATYVGPLGVGRSGFALGGPAGVVFVPTGWAGAVDDTLVRIPLAQLRGAHSVAPSAVGLVGDYAGELRLDADSATLDGIAAWFARASQTIEAPPRIGGVVAHAVVWQLDEQQAWRAELSVVQGQLTLSAVSGAVDPLRVPLGQVERVRVRTDGRDPLFVGRVEGRVHTLRPIGSASGLRRLDGLLRGSRGDAGPRTVDTRRWQRLAGSHREARLFRGASAEGSLADVVIEVTQEGVRLRGRPRGGALASRHITEGMRVRVTLPRGRGWQHFAAHVRQLEHEVGPQARIEAVRLVLMPIDDGPKVAQGRRSFHRVAIEEHLPFPMKRMRLTEDTWFQAILTDLSAGGFAALLDAPLSKGARLRAELPTQEWCDPFEAEVVHCRPARNAPGQYTIGFRLLGITEMHRSLLQREVLRHDRAQLAKKRRAARVTSTPESEAYASK